MAALTGDRATRTRAQHRRTIVAKLAAATTIFKGGMVARNAAGFVVPASDTAGLTVLGIALSTVVNAGAAGAVEIAIDTGADFKFLNGTDPVVQADLNGRVYVQDDQTVRNAGGTADIVAGVAVLIEPDGVWVHIDAADNLALAA